MLANDHFQYSAVSSNDCVCVCTHVWRENVCVLVTGVLKCAPGCQDYLHGLVLGFLSCLRYDPFPAAYTWLGGLRESAYFPVPPFPVGT